jgi:hypothetical protein
MAVQPGSISSQPAAGTLTGGELLPLDQDVGSPVAATALTVGQGYRIVSLGNTNWQTVGAGASAAVGTVFSCEAVGTGTGTAQRVDCRRVTAQALAALAGVAAAILAHEQAADPHPGYTTAQELSNALQNYLTTSAAAQAYQPLSTNLTNLAAVAGQTAFGRAFLALADQAGARDYVGLGPDDSATLTGLTLSGLATLPHIHGNLAGGLYAHVKNLSGGALAAGTPLRITGTVGDTTTLQVVAASASSAETMPALFVLSEPLANNAEGHATLLGEITGLNTAGMTPGAPLFVPPGGGVLTTTRPAANAQQVATVGRAHATTGSVHVLPWPVLGTAAAAATTDFATTEAFSPSAPGLVPASGGGTTNFLRADGTFAAPPGGGATEIDVQIFLSNGTWTKPAGAVLCEVWMAGGGAGAGSGRRGAAGTDRSGGGGGSHAGCIYVQFNASRLNATEAVVIGAQGIGGAAVTTDDTNGINGTDGGNTTFAGMIAVGGLAGAGGTTTTGAAGAARASSCFFQGFDTALASTTAGTAGAVGAVSSTAICTGIRSGSGGGGCGITSANTRTGQGGASLGVTGVTIGIVFPSSGPITGDGVNGVNGSMFRYFGTGGSGGNGNPSGAGGRGGDGGGYGAAGGGGGASLNGFPSGRGGDGSPGIVVVITTIKP